MVNRDDYYVFCSNNTQVANNEVVIALNKNFLKIDSVKSFLSEDHTYPDHLEIRCVHKKTNQKIAIVGMRIHAMKITDEQKKKEFDTVLKSLEDIENVIIVGDFNNRRGFYNQEKWCIIKVKQLAKEYNFEMYTFSRGKVRSIIPCTMRVKYVFYLTIEPR